MATVILKPIEDTNIDSNLERVKSNRAYWDYIASDDNDRAYITCADGARVDSTSTFKMGLDSSVTLPNYFKVNNIKIMGEVFTNESNAKRITSAGASFGYTAGTRIKSTKDVEYSCADGSTTTFSNNFDGFDTSVEYTPADFDNVLMTMKVYGQAASDSKSIKVEIDYINMELDYTPIEKNVMYVRSGGSWIACTPYKKINGTWVEQDVNFLGSSNLSSLYYKG